MKVGEMISLGIVISLGILLLVGFWPFSSPWDEEEGKPYRLTISKPREVGEKITETTVYTIDATSREKWAYFDFSRGTVVEIGERTSLDWDLAFQRHRILSNGGATHPAGRAGILNLGKVDFQAVTTAPESGYIPDTGAGLKGITENDAVAHWYDYRILSHALKPKGEVYIIRTADNKYAKMRILSYYCEGKKPGCMTIEYVYQGNGSREFVKLSEARIEKRENKVHSRFFASLLYLNSKSTLTSPFDETIASFVWTWGASYSSLPSLSFPVTFQPSCQAWTL